MLVYTFSAHYKSKQDNQQRLIKKGSSVEN